MKVRGFDVGVESISRWRTVDETHLPTEGELSPQFVPEISPLDEILRPPSLDERIPRMTAPDNLDAALLQPRVMAETKERLLALLQDASQAGDPVLGLKALRAAAMLTQDMAMDDEIRAAMTALYRG